VITAAVAQAEHGHKLDRVLTAEVTAMCVIVGALFPDHAASPGKEVETCRARAGSVWGSGFADARRRSAEVGKL
jgi:hypothetical protein